MGIPKILAIIPTYNEEAQIGSVLQRFSHSLVDEVLVINDGSTDATPKIIAKFPVKVIAHKRKLGVGRCIKDGIDYALRNAYNILVVMAGNGKDDPREIPRLLKPILEENYDYVQGSRFLAGGEWKNLPFARLLAIKTFSLIWSIYFHRRITDITNGFRAYRTALFNDTRINIWQEWLDTYELEYYLQYKVLGLEYKFKEVPVSKVYPEKKKYTKIRPFVDWWKIVKPIIYLGLRIKK